MTLLDKQHALEERVRRPKAPPAGGPNLLWWGVAIVGLAVTLLFTAWVVTTQPAALPDSVTGFAYDHEVTAIRLATPQEPMAFVGQDAALDPDVPYLVGFEYADEATAFHLATLREPMAFVGQDANLDPNFGIMLTGFAYDHEVTPIHLATLREPMTFVGQDANLDPDV
jgi:hypothetical protein